MKKLILLLLLIISAVGLSKLNASESSPQFVQGNDTLVVYRDIPGHTALVNGINPRIKSDVYEIRVRSAATNNEWVQCFANYTYNRGLELPKITGNDGTVYDNIQAYNKYCAGWSHTYANIEMSENSIIEVEISKIGNALLDGVAVIEKSAVHPSHKVFDKRDENGKVYFKLNKACQVVIDINGQMDDHNSSVAGLEQIGPVHAITFFANPVIVKPPTTGAGIRYVTAGTMPNTDTNFSTMVFGPGVHYIGAGFKIYAKKSYYIPGDAILYGSLTNSGTPVNGRTNGDGISIYGYGTLSGFFSPHFWFDLNNPSYPNYNGGAQVGLSIDDYVDISLKGITIVDPANFCTNILPAANISVDNSKAAWMKAISWRTNGDGINGRFPITDCFIRTNDDATTLFGERKRCTFWKDTNGNIIRLRNWTPGATYIMDDCDVIYNRRRPGASGSSIVLSNGEPWKYQKQIFVDVTMKNVRFHDRKSNMPIFSLNSDGVSYHGLKFENISCYVPIVPDVKNSIFGTAATPWNEGLVLKDVTFNHDNGQPPVVVNDNNFKTYFVTNEFVNGVLFRMPYYYNLTKNANPVEGTITLTTNSSIRASDGAYYEKSTVILEATALPGYTFTGWSGDIVSTTNPLTIVMDGNKTITANFNVVGAQTLTITTVTNGTISVNPAGASQSTNSTVTLTAKPAVGYKFDSWSGDLAGNNIVTTLKMDADKTVSASFVKTNNFAINCGGDQYIAADGTVYAQTPTGTFNTTATITATTDQILYKSEKIGKTFSYDLPVDNGEYTVTLKFAEIFWQAAGKRVFNCSIEETAVLTNFDIFSEAGVRYKALDKTFKTQVADGILNIAFTTTLDNAKISAIKVANDAETSVIQPSLNNSITIYPNPATDLLFYNSADKLISKIELVDLTGKILYSANMQLHSGSLDLKGTARGMYLVKIHADNYIFTKKISVK